MTQGPGVDPAWSPDGSTIAYASGSDYVYFVNADGTGERVFTIPMQGVGPEVAPAWSPDGRSIAFAAYAPPEVGNEAALFVAPVDGTNAGGTLAYNATQSRYLYTWSSDKAWSGTCRAVTLTLRDGTTHRADFRLTK